jgi:pimeloyl-ACP methyl ester carboxylesterase
VAVLDIDGVLADVRHRLSYVEQRPKDWQTFFAAAVNDSLLPEGLEVALDLADRFTIVYLTGRPERCRTDTEAWLEKYHFPAGQLIMRRDTDRRAARYTKLDELKTPQQLRPYASLDDVAARLIKNNRRLSPERAAWLATHWAERRDDGRWHVLGDPAHKRINPMIYRKDQVLEAWKCIAAPTLWVEGDETDPDRWWGHRYPRSEFEARIALVPTLTRQRLAGCGHMLHFDQPQALAAAIERFVDEPA